MAPVRGRAAAASPLLQASFVLLGAACTKGEPLAPPLEHVPSTTLAEISTRGDDRRPACGPRGLPPDRHFAAEGLCVRVVAHDQGNLRALTFAPNGDLFGVTFEGEIRRYRDVDRDGLYSPGAPETVVWATLGGEPGLECAFAAPYFYCATEGNVVRLRWEADGDRGANREPVVAGAPRGGARELPLAVRDGWLYVAGGPARDATEPLPRENGAPRAVIKRFPLARFDGKKPMAWRDGEVFVQGHGLGDLVALRKDARGRLVGIATVDDRPKDEGADALADGRRDAVVALDKGAAHDLGSLQARSSARALVFPAPDAPLALPERYRRGAFVALHGSWSRDRSTGHAVVWLPFDDEEPPKQSAVSDPTAFSHEVIFGGGRHGQPRDGAWSWKIGSAGEDPVRPGGLAISPVDGALYVSSDNAEAAGGRAPTGTIYRVALLGR
jgi:hypothetical protein